MSMPLAGAELETRGVWHLLSAPTIVHDATGRRFPLLVRMMLGIIGANDFMQLRTSGARASRIRPTNPGLQGQAGRECQSARLRNMPRG
jgi:hypothetical protein